MAQRASNVKVLRSASARTHRRCSDENARSPRSAHRITVARAPRSPALEASHSLDAPGDSIEEKQLLMQAADSDEFRWKEQRRKCKTLDKQQRRSRQPTREANSEYNSKQRGGGKLDGQCTKPLQRSATDLRSTNSLEVPPFSTSQKHGKLDASATIVLDCQLPAKHPKLAQKSSAASSLSQKDTWRLRYKDFMPEAVSQESRWTKDTESFHSLIEKANNWLKSNEDVRVKTCETVTWMSPDIRPIMDYQGELMATSKLIAEDSTSYCIRGLRLWLGPQTYHVKSQRLGFVDITPSSRSESIQDLVAKLNDMIDKNILRGQVLTTETIGIRINEEMEAEKEAKISFSNSTRWTDCSSVDSNYVFCIRVFFNNNANGHIYGSEKAHIGLKDFVPLPSNESYQGFEDLIERANVWISEKSGVVITNMQSVIVQKHSDSHSETGTDCFYTIPGANRHVPVDFFRILRAAFVKPIGDLLVSLPVQHPFVYETFLPEIVTTKEKRKNSNERMEKLSEVFNRIANYLQNSAADIICVETVLNPVQIYPQDATSIVFPTDEIRFLFTIRLYLNGKLGPIDGNGSRSLNRGSLTSTKNKRHSSSEHPGPIFLRHVVSRRFKYRWLILSVTVITCMTIVVIVSVVYSNL